jgi:hypothetical protein|eukprot:COSAG02_NODE_1132_length_14392_cov_7.068910_8_plen_98_part_00
MHTCEDTASVKLVLRQMEEAGIPYDPATFMTCFKVFCRSGEYDKAVRSSGRLTTVHTLCLTWVLGHLRRSKFLLQPSRKAFLIASEYGKQSTTRSAS